MRRLPPLNAIRAFEAAARHVSFTRAAGELFVTHGAVSRQIALLETWLGVKLFRRSPSQLSLTEAGRLYLPEVTTILDRLALASMAVKQSAAPAVLRINAPPTFTMRWLIPRLSEFQRRHPDVELRLSARLGPINSGDASVDIAILAGQADIPGWKAVPFMSEFIAPVCRTDLVKRTGVETPVDLRALTLVTYQTEPYGWEDWMATSKSIPSPDQERLRFEQMFFALQAVQSGLGIGLFPLFLVIDELVDGHLCVPFGKLGVSKRTYSAWIREDLAGLPLVEDFCRWLNTAGSTTEGATAEWMTSRGWAP